jgi:cytochrome c oxidase subunit II
MQIITAQGRRVLAMVALSGALGIPAGVEGQAPRVIRIAAERFAFTPSEITLEPGEEVELRLTSDDTAHGFRVVGTNTNVTIPKRGRKELSVVFRAPAAGRYVFECSRMCGAGHHFMRGTLVVRERTDRAAGR